MKQRLIETFAVFGIDYENVQLCNSTSRNSIVAEPKLYLSKVELYYFHSIVDKENENTLTEKWCFKFRIDLNGMKKFYLRAFFSDLENPITEIKLVYPYIDNERKLIVT